MRRDVLVRLFARVVNAGLYAIVMVLLARGMGAASFGSFGAILALATFFGMLVAMGTSELALSAGHESARVSGQAFALRLMTTPLVLGFALAAGVVIESPTAVSVVAGVFVASESLNDLLQSAFSGLGFHSWASVILVANRALQCTIVVTALSFDMHVLHGFALGAGASLVLLVFVGTIGLKPRPLETRWLFARAQHYWGAVVSGQISNVDVVLAHQFATSEVAGSLTAGLRAARPLNLVITSLLYVFTPRMASAERLTAYEDFKRLRRLGLYFASGAFFLAPGAAWAMPLILGPDFESGRIVFAAVFVSVGLSGLSQCFQAYLFARGRAELARRAILKGSVFGVVCLAALAAQFGALGVAAGEILLQASILLLFVVTLRRSRDL